MVRQEKCNFERWLWIDLIGFDNQKNDFGVKEYLDKIGFVPEVMSLFICSPDFIHNHDGMKQDGDFPADFCSYGGHPYSEERERQVWTKYQLKRLIDELHDYKVKVYFSVFTMFLGNKFHKEWVSEHSEILETRRNGEKNMAINPLKRFRDNKYYEDFFIKKLVEVMNDYGSDGYHGADGYNHLRLPLYEIDYSDDMIEQFIKTKAAKLPENIAEECDGNREQMEKRADWIWRNKRLEWIEFFVNRWEGFYQKVVSALHKEGKQVVVNSSWTRDPFEAIYRYGIDYRKIANTGIDSLIVETVAGPVAIGGQGAIHSHPLYNSLAMLLLIKSYIPDTKLYFLNCIHDMQEQWDVLRHAPTLLEREIYSLSNMYYYDSQGKFKLCVEGLLVTLASCIHNEEWKWLQDKWNLGFSIIIPQRIIGPTLVWSDKAFEKQIYDFIDTRRWTTHRIMYQLMAEGVPIQSSVNVKHLEKVSGTILIINSHLFPEEELKKIFTYKNGPIIVIGGKTKSLPEPDFQFEDVYSPNQLLCGIYGLKKKFKVKIEKDGEGQLPDDMMGLSEPFLFTQELYFREVSDNFLKSCKQIISASTNGVKVLSGEDSVKVLAMEQEEGKLRLLIGNDNYLYVSPEFDIGKDIDSIKVLTKFPGMPVIPQGSKFRVKISGKGMVILDIILK